MNIAMKPYICFEGVDPWVGENSKTKAPTVRARDLEPTSIRPLGV